MKLGMTAAEVAAHVASGPSPIILDIRREPTFASASDSLPGAIRRDPAEVASWAAELELARPIVVFCAHGREVTAEVTAVAAATGAAPFDVPNVELTHLGDACSFDTFLARYRLDDPALARLAPIVRGADTDRHDIAPQAAGLFAISLGLSACHPDDHVMLRHGLLLYDAFYRWCRDLQEETHGWPPRS